MGELSPCLRVPPTLDNLNDSLPHRRVEDVIPIGRDASTTRTIFGGITQIAHSRRSSTIRRDTRRVTPLTSCGILKPEFMPHAEVMDMSTTSAVDATPKKVEEHEATLNRYLAEMEQMQKEIANNRREIEQLRAETEAMLQNTLALLKLK